MYKIILKPNVYIFVKNKKCILFSTQKWILAMENINMTLESTVQWAEKWNFGISKPTLSISQIPQE